MFFITSNAIKSHFSPPGLVWSTTVFFFLSVYSTIVTYQKSLITAYG